MENKKEQCAAISNGEISIAVSPVGAEMQSLKLTKNGRELLWQGLPEYWHGRSPILFPAVGGLWNGTYRLDGKAYQMPKHGFMREKTWTLEEETPSSLTFVYKDKGEDREAFPWPYEVRVKYTLEGRHVRATFMVKNLGTSPMYFQMGGHPGIALPDFKEKAEVDGYLKLEGKNITHVLRATEQGCTEPQPFAFPVNEKGLVPLCVETFANEALIFNEHQVERATVLDKEERPLVAVSSSAPVWLFWSPQGVHTPFICAEPWYGLCDPIGFEGPVEQRPYINKALPGETWTGYYDIEVLAE